VDFSAAMREEFPVHPHPAVPVVKRLSRHRTSSCMIGLADPAHPEALWLGAILSVLL
jgi:hypothetical protein